MTKLVMLEIAAASVAALFLLLILIYRLWSKRLKKPKYVANWRELQAMCKNKQTWPDALIAADKLLDKALKKRRFKGKTMGARLVAADERLSDSDDIWQAHNLVKKILVSKRRPSLSEKEVKEALVTYRQALKDLGALPK